MKKHFTLLLTLVMLLHLIFPIRAFAGKYSMENTCPDSYVLPELTIYTSNILRLDKQEHTSFAAHYISGKGYKLAKIINGSTADSVLKVSHKDSNMTIQGTLYQDDIQLDGEKHSFELTYTCKYVYIDGRGSKKISKKKFFKESKRCEFTAISFDTNKKGKIKKIWIDYSM